MGDIAKQVAKSAERAAQEEANQYNSDVASASNTTDNEAVAFVANTINQQKTKVESSVNDEMTIDDVTKATDKYSRSNNQTTTERRNQISKLADAQNLQDIENSYNADQELLSANEMYLTKDQPIQVGTYSGKYVGNVPIFAAPAALMPLNIIENRAKNLSKAAKKRVDARNKAIEALYIDAPEQFQRQMDDITDDMINYFGEKSGWKYEHLNNPSTKTGREYARTIRKMKDVAKTVTDYDGLAEKILEESAKDNTYVPPRLMKVATDIRDGVINTKELFYNDKKYEEFTNLGAQLKVYQNMIGVLGKDVVARVEPNLAPAIGEWIGASDDKIKKQLLDAYTKKSLGGTKAAFMQVIRENYPQDEIIPMVEAVIKNNNVYYNDATDAEKKEIMGEAMDYVWGALGEKIKITEFVTDLAVKGSNGSKTVPSTIYTSMRDHYTNNKESANNTMYANVFRQDDQGNDVDVTTYTAEDWEKFRKQYMNTTTSRSASNGTTVYKSRVETTKKHYIQGGQERIEDIRFGLENGESITAAQWHSRLPQDKKFYELSTQEQETLLMISNVGRDDDSLKNMTVGQMQVDQTGTINTNMRESKQEEVVMVEWNGKQTPLTSDIMKLAATKGQDVFKELMNSAHPVVYNTMSALKWDGKGTTDALQQLFNPDASDEEIKRTGWEVNGSVVPFTLSKDISDDGVVDVLNKKYGATIERTKGKDATETDSGYTPPVEKNRQKPDFE